MKNNAKACENRSSLNFFSVLIFLLFTIAGSSCTDSDPAETALMTTHIKRGKNAVEKIEDYAVLARIALEAKSEAAGLAAALKLGELELLEQITADIGNKDAVLLYKLHMAFENVPDEHRNRLMEAIFPVIRVLNKPEVSQKQGEIISIEVQWRSINRLYGRPGYGSGNKPGERIDCLLKLSRLSEVLSQSWRSAFPEDVRIRVPNQVWRGNVELTFEKAEIEIEDLLLPAFEVLDKGLLEIIAMENHNPRIRLAALKNLEDQQLLAQYALQDRNEFVRQAAVKKLTIQKMLERAALKDTSRIVRKTAVLSLSDQNFLRKIAEKDKIEDVRISAVNQLTDSYILAGIARKSRDRNIGLAAIELIGDPQLLASAALEARNARVRHSAVERLEDQELLLKVASKSRRAHVRSAAVKKLENQEALIRAALNDRNEDVRVAAVANVNRQPDLERIFFESKSQRVRRAVIANLTDQQLLSRIALEDGSWRVRWAAVNKLGNTEILIKIAAQDKHRGVRNIAERRLETLRKEKTN